MKYLIAILALLASLAYAEDEVQYYVLPQPDGSALVILPPEAVKVCAESGGCRIMTGDELKAWAAEQAKRACGRET